ncbi:MAG: hypothetical protein Q9227_006587 [Pyrenula ochraceoflavens]
MSGDSASPPKSGGMISLYANLLDPSSASTPGSISSAPVSYQKSAPEASPEQDETAKKQQAMAASLRFQPTKRPQLAAQKAKAKAIAAKFAQPSGSATVTAAEQPVTQVAAPEKPMVDSPASVSQAANKSSIADWTATASDDELNSFYTEKRQRGGRKKRKKNNKGVEEVPQNWDDIYDPSRPNNYEDYKQSEEKIREIREWKDRLYAHRTKRRESSDYDSEEEGQRPQNQRFAPPPTMSFAPPHFNDEPTATPPPPPPLEPPNDATGEDAYARRMRISQGPPPPPPQSFIEDVPAPPVSNPSATPAPAPTQPPAGQISRAPVRYNLPPPSADLPSSEAELESAMDETQETPITETEPTADEPRSLRPGQAGFAERLLMKQGWTKGSGLGAKATGIVNPLYAKVDKRKKKSDAEGGGYATPAGTGKILGGQKSAKAKQDEMSKFGEMSEVVVLKGMLKGMDLDEEMSREEGGIMQEIGEECGDKYGNVERVYIHRGSNEAEEGGTVFVRFTSQLSGLRAVNALEGRVFNGNAITARFGDREKFDKGIYL